MTTADEKCFMFAWIKVLTAVVICSTAQCNVCVCGGIYLPAIILSAGIDLR